MSSSERFQLAIECGLVLFACSALPVGLLVWRHGAESDVGYWMVVGIPATAMLLFVVSAMSVPSLFAVRRLTFPLQITLPLLFCALLLVSVMLWTTTSEGLVRSEDVLALAHIWEQPADLLVAGAMQMVALSLLSLLKSAPR